MPSVGCAGWVGCKDWYGVCGGGSGKMLPVSIILDLVPSRWAFASSSCEDVASSVWRGNLESMAMSCAVFFL